MNAWRGLTANQPLPPAVHLTAVTPFPASMHSSMRTIYNLARHHDVYKSTPCSGRLLIPLLLHLFPPAPMQVHHSILHYNASPCSPQWMDGPSYTVTSFPSTLNASCHALSWIKSMHLHEYYPLPKCNLQLHGTSTAAASALLFIAIAYSPLPPACGVQVYKCALVQLCICAFVHLCIAAMVCKCTLVQLCICALMHCSHGVQQSLVCFKDSEESPNYYYTAPLTGLWCALHHCKCNKALQQRVRF